MKEEVKIIWKPSYNAKMDHSKVVKALIRTSKIRLTNLSNKQRETLVKINV